MVAHVHMYALFKCLQVKGMHAHAACSMQAKHVFPQALLSANG